jgi:preprotein translocase subunit SecD
MKTIKSLIVLMLLCITLISSSWNTAVKGKIITIKADGSEVTPELLKQSAEVISARLRTYGIDTFYLNIFEASRQIEIAIPEKCNLQEVGKLITQKGNLAFYDTYSRDDVELLLKDTQLIDLFAPDGSRIGCAPLIMLEKANEIIKSYKTQDIKFCWHLSDDNIHACLYALKMNPVIVRSDIDKISGVNGENILLELNHEATKKWSEITRNSIGKTIAIVMDDKVLSDPVIRMPIDSGKCEISGKFTKSDISFFLALVNDGILPLNFTVIK